jgi:16S rRNA (adenine1518-N6/adenine1519-N6)-dimethyltransferase
MQAEDLTNSKPRSLKALFAEYGDYKTSFKALKKFSQNYILDENFNHKIASFVDNDDAVLEIGSGLGTLTRALLDKKRNKIHLIEKDVRFKPLLEPLKDYGIENIIWGDALKVDWSWLKCANLVSNLPYSIASQIFIKACYDPMIHTLVLMFQKEVAMKMVADVGSSNYGRISIIAQSIFQLDLVLHAPSRLFIPPPKVDSAVIYGKRITGDSALNPSQIKNLETITQIAFSKKRKKVANSLGKVIAENILRQAQITTDKRPQEISVAEYCQLAKLITN